MKKSIVVFLLGLLLTSGIIRHDVPESQYLALAKETQFECVGEIIKTADSSAIGSCVLIADKYLLTAAHCLTDSDTKADTLKYKNETMIVYTPINFYPRQPKTFVARFKNKCYKVKRYIVHPSYKEHEVAYDMALIELEEIVAHIALPVLNTATDELNDTITGVGFGVSGIASDPETVHPLSKKIGGQNIIDKIGGYKDSATNLQGLLMADFDHPKEGKKCNQLGTISTLPLEYTVGGGDSGSGAFRKKNGVWQLVGICSGADINFKLITKYGYYGTVMNWTRVSLYHKWITANMQP